MKDPFDATQLLPGESNLNRQIFSIDRSNLVYH